MRTRSALPAVSVMPARAFTGVVSRNPTRVNLQVGIMADFGVRESEWENEK